ncbi:MAG: hypothetical protein JW776_10825 [Candidatus Lokiarchaeota archaeon]|nr:hypothetical protein [Candidatus Lokiarchaeota archaeon]
MDLKFHAFDKSGKQNTVRALTLAKENADILGIKDILIASTEGYTAEQAVKIFDPNIYNLFVITHSFGFRDGTDQEFNEVLRQNLEKQGVHVHSSTHVYSGIGPALHKEWGFWDYSNIFARTVRKLFSDGVKVCHEIALIAADSGLVKPGSDVISVGGTGRGADTVCWIKATSSHNFLDARIKAILAKPI